MPNTAVDMNSWAVSACYPRSTFYPLSDGPSIQNHRITKTYFRTCSTCLSRSQAPLCLYTQCAISDRAEGTFVLLRYSLGGDRPSQTTHHTLSPTRITGLRLELQTRPGWYFKVGSTRTGVRASKPPTYPTQVRFKVQCEAIVKVHGVFPSSRGYTASSQRFQFH